jgi:hypothetical protein
VQYCAPLASHVVTELIGEDQAVDSRRAECGKCKRCFPGNAQLFRRGVVDEIYPKRSRLRVGITLKRVLSQIRWWNQPQRMGNGSEEVDASKREMEYPHIAF